MTNNSRLTFTSYAYFFLVGFLMNIGGAVTNALGRSLLVETAIIGYCFSVFMIGRLIGISGSGMLIKTPALNKNLYIRLVPLVLLISVAALQYTNSVTLLALCLFAAGVGIGGFYSISNMILVDLYSGKQKSFHISMINFFYSVGSICSPFIAGILLQNNFTWNRPYLVFAGIIILVLIITSTTDYSDLYAHKTAEVKDSQKMSGSLWIICAAIVMYILAEFSITYWTPVYMREALGKNALFAGSCVSTFWVAVLVGRLSAGFILRFVRPRAYILASGTLTILSLGMLYLLSTDTAILIAMFFSGLFCAGLFPSIFTYGTDLSESLKRTFPTLMMLSAATGSFLAMPAGSLVKNLIGIKYMLFIPAIALCATCILIFSTGLTRRKKSA